MGIPKKPIEINLYYLNSRYYDSETSRFTSMDNIEYINPDTINGLNLYAYCNNNPVMNVDPSGKFFVSLLIGLAIGALIGGALGIATTFGGLVGVGVIGIKTALIGLGATTAISFSAGIGSNVLQSVFRGEKINWKNALIDGSLTAIQSVISFGMGAALSYSGSWNSLNKPQLSSSFKLFRSSGQRFLKSAFNGTLLYLEQNDAQILTRTFVKTIFSLPWSFLRNSI